MGALHKRALSKLVLVSARFFYLFAVGKTSPGFLGLANRRAVGHRVIVRRPKSAMLSEGLRRVAAIETRRARKPLVAYLFLA